MHLIALVSWNPEIRNILSLGVGVGILVGSVVLLLSTNAGPRTGILIGLASLLGWLMIMGEPVRELINPFFWIKMGLVVFGILITIWFHKGVIKHVNAGREIVATDKATAAFLVILWMMIMYCGRFIAYAPV